jgi:hypothetical protein
LLDGRRAWLSEPEKWLVQTHIAYEAAMEKYADGFHKKDRKRCESARTDLVIAAQMLAQSILSRAEGGPNSELSDSASEGARRSREP